jgi:hypothetical protein
VPESGDQPVATPDSKSLEKRIVPSASCASTFTPSVDEEHAPKSAGRARRRQVHARGRMRRT